MKYNKEIFKDITPQEARDALKTNMDSILSNIQKIMTDKGVSRKELSFRINSHEAHVSRIFRRGAYKNGLTIAVLTRISLGLEVPLNDLVK